MYYSCCSGLLIVILVSIDFQSISLYIIVYLVGLNMSQPIHNLYL